MVPACDWDKYSMMTEFKIHFKKAGEDFTERLIECIDIKDNNDTVTELMYRHLFISFLSLFGIRCQFSDCLSTKSMKINGQTVSGKPDVIVRSLKFDTAKRDPIVDWKTLVICEVKKDFKREEVKAPKKRRYSKARNLLPPLPEDVIGQHGAELLLYYPTSVKDNHIIGMIVEKTLITLAGLSLTKHQYDQMMDGKLTDYDIIYGPKLFVTQPYDYLVWEDRKQLTKALITLGFLQNHERSEFLLEKMPVT